MTVVRLDAYETPDGGVRVIIPLPVSTDGNPPSEMRLFAAGDNDTTKGVYRFTPESARTIMAEFAERGIEKMADYNHASIPQQRDDGTERAPTAEEGRASCWYRLEVREQDGAPELWAGGIRWTPDAAKYVTNRDYRYTSNAFLFDRKTLAITRFLNFGLVNDPAAKRLPALVAASQGTRPQPTEIKTMKMSDKACSAFKKAMEGDYEGPAQMRKAMMAALKEADMEPDEDDKPGAKKMSAILGCDPDMTAVLTSIGSLRSDRAEVLALAGKATLSEAVGVFRGWKDNADSGTKAKTDLATLAESKRLSDFDAAIEAAKVAMKLAPADLLADAEPAKYIASLRADGAGGFKALSAWLGVLTPKVVTVPTPRPTDEPVTVSEIDRALCAQLGTSVENVALLRAGKPLPKPQPAAK